MKHSVKILASALLEKGGMQNASFPCRNNGGSTGMPLEPALIREHGLPHAQFLLGFRNPILRQKDWVIKNPKVVKLP